MDKLQGIHLLLTYRCDRECDHCFVWGSPKAGPTMTLEFIREILRQAKLVRSINMVYFEGGEPFLFFPVLLEGARMVRAEGYDFGVVTNGYWGTSVEDAYHWLRELKDLDISDLSISSDPLHEVDDDKRAFNAHAAANELGIPAAILKTCLPEGTSKGDVLFRGRAAKTLAKEFRDIPWRELRDCPESLLSPSRVHIDPLGNVHVCQGVVIGNIRKTPLMEIARSYDPEEDLVIGPLIRGGPAELIRAHHLRHRPTYADACELCYEARTRLRERYPSRLCPKEMYGEVE